MARIDISGSKENKIVMIARKGDERGSDTDNSKIKSYRDRGTKRNNMKQVEGRTRDNYREVDDNNPKEYQWM